MKEIIKKNDDLIIQSIGAELSEINRISNLAESLKVEFSNLLSGEILNDFRTLVDLDMFDKSIYFIVKKIHSNQYYCFNNIYSMMRRFWIGVAFDRLKNRQ